MGRGPLAMSQCAWTQNLLQFGVVLALPVIPTDGGYSSALAEPMRMQSVCAALVHLAADSQRIRWMG
jgi:hypothetical protein